MASQNGIHLAHSTPNTEVLPKTISKAPAEDPSVSSTRPRQVHLSRDQILNATERCLMQVGYDGTTIRRLAAELGCAVGSVYRYFKDKRELLYAVTQRPFEQVVQMAQSGRSMTQCEKIYRRLARRSPQMYRLMFWLASVNSTKGNEEDLPQVVQRIVTAWEAALGDRQAAAARWSAVHGRVMLWQENLPDQLLPDQTKPSHQESVLAELRPLPGPGTNAADPMHATHHETAAITSERQEGSEDVCLL